MSQEPEQQAQDEELSPAEPRWLNPQEQRTWRTVLRANQLMRVAMGETFARYDLRVSEYELLAMLSEAAAQRMRMASLADLIVQSRSRVSHTATRLQRRGLVRRLPTARDGRGVVLALTPEGRELVERIAPQHVETVRRAFFDQLRAGESEQLETMLRRVVLANRSSPGQARDVE